MKTSVPSMKLRQRAAPGEHPERVDVKRIRGKLNSHYRIRLGDYRVVYAVINGKIVVITTLFWLVRAAMFTRKCPA